MDGESSLGDTTRRGLHAPPPRMLHVNFAQPDHHLRRCEVRVREIDISFRAELRATICSLNPSELKGSIVGCYLQPAASAGLEERIPPGAKIHGAAVFGDVLSETPHADVGISRDMQCAEPHRQIAPWPGWEVRMQLLFPLPALALRLPGLVQRLFVETTTPDPGIARHPPWRHDGLHS